MQTVDQYGSRLLVMTCLENIVSLTDGQAMDNREKQRTLLNDLIRGYCAKKGADKNKEVVLVDLGKRVSFGGSTFGDIRHC